jgi:hypothetical protein
MEVYYQCHVCKNDQVAQDVTEEVPTPVMVEVFCSSCNARNHILEEAREKWLEDRGFEVRNTSKPKWYVKDAVSLDDFVYEFSLIYQVHHPIAMYQVGYYSMALLFFQEWAVKHGFDKMPRYILKITVSYDHHEGNAHYFSNKECVGFCGTEEAVEKVIVERMSWQGYGWLVRGNFSIERIDTG